MPPFIGAWRNSVALVASATWVTDSPPKKKRSPSLASSTSLPSIDCWSASRGSPTPFKRYTCCTNPEQSIPLRVATPQIGHPEERLSRREKVFACRVTVREIDEGRDMLARDEASALSAITNEPYFQPAALVWRRGRAQAARRRGKTRFGDEGAAGKLRQDRRRGGRPLTDGRRCDDDHSVAPVLGELVQVGARTPSEVKVLALYISPLVARSKDSDVFAPVRLIDELAIGSRLRVQVERTSSHHRAVRPDDRNTDGRYVGRCHLSTGRRAAPTSSRCRSGVFFGASRTAAGSRATWSAIRTSAAPNASSVSFGSVSVGSTMSASGTISGK